MTSAALESIEIEALVTDRYLDALLAAAERRAQDAPADPSLDPALRRAALRLRDELVRVHPSFRFEERLARRLAEAAAGMRLVAAAGGDGAILPFPTTAALSPTTAALSPATTALSPTTAALSPTTPAAEARADAVADAARVPNRRPLLAGAAVTSAALSLAGAAFVAWRLTRGAGTDPLARAVRLARLARATPDGSPAELH
ncbi:MAG TPA: hypothetical protein VLM76_04585 [Patescibacteria group bacterium]|nr:hypothetical protein [Patescibacteria group bacterium]